MKCYDVGVLNAEMSFFQPRDDFRSCVNLGKSHSLINDSVTEWQVFEPTPH